MAENSGIQWTDHTFNPWIGCAKVSPACKFCYAESQDKRWRGGNNWGVNADRTKTSDSNWKKPLKWNAQAEKEGVRYKVFCASLADVFEDRDDLDPWRHELMRLIIDTPHLDWLLLTKRPDQVMEYFRRWHYKKPLSQGIPKNIWFGASIEDQERYDERMTHLKHIKEATSNIVFASCEPLLGLIDWAQGMPDWVIVGGESGDVSKIRRMNIYDVEAVYRSCSIDKVPFFFKQTGTLMAKTLGMTGKGGDLNELPVEYHWMNKREFPIIE